VAEFKDIVKEKPLENASFHIVIVMAILDRFHKYAVSEFGHIFSKETLNETKRLHLLYYAAFKSSFFTLALKNDVCHLLPV